MYTDGSGGGRSPPASETRKPRCPEPTARLSSKPKETIQASVRSPRSQANPPIFRLKPALSVAEALADPITSIRWVATRFPFVLDRVSERDLTDPAAPWRAANDFRRAVRFLATRRWQPALNCERTALEWVRDTERQHYGHAFGPVRILAERMFLAAALALGFSCAPAGMRFGRQQFHLSIGDAKPVPARR